ncbi:MAG: inverse autotransporter beta domain-containing protein [Cyanobium sp. LacPavin_0818_WC50_MAG_67_9]|nr:inverse autotransporter beta domain-containing protein [Cyanobium sp. LacPavin_0818_WC50_MAG_67_9]
MPSQAGPSLLPIRTNSGLAFQSQGAGFPNVFSGYFFRPLLQGQSGQLLFLDAAANLNLGGGLSQQSDVSMGGSVRLGYRWLSSDQNWIYGVNAGMDTRKAYSQYSMQAGMGAEALTKNIELRANGYIPFYNQADLYQSGYSGGSLVDNQLVIDAWNRYVVSLSGVNLEAGIPIFKWKKESIWIYASYYSLGGDYVDRASGIRGRTELRLGSQLILGASLSYDDIFLAQATGYMRYGSKPMIGNARDDIDTAEFNFLALRGAPIQRDTDIRMISAQQDLPNTIALNTANGKEWVVRCTGATSSKSSVNCSNTTFASMIESSRSGDVLLAGEGATLNLSGQTVDSQGRPTLLLPTGASLYGIGSAPSILTQFGAVNLNQIFGNRVGERPSINNGVIQIGSNTTIAGFRFANASITGIDADRILVASNTFDGSYSPTPGLTTYSDMALPAIDLKSISNAVISENSFSTPNLQSYASATGDPSNSNVCTSSGISGICLSGNAIRIGPNQQGAVSSDVSITKNMISGALDEAIRLDNVNGKALIAGNTISGMRNGPDTNLGAAIFVRQWSGSSNIVLDGNTVLDNEAYAYQINLGGSVSSGSVGTDFDSKNVVDVFEVGLCRGSATFGNGSDDKYGDDFGAMNCDPAAPATMTYLAKGNYVQTSGSDPAKYGEDGFDLNIGSSARFVAQIDGNYVKIGNTNEYSNPLTADLRGNSGISMSVENNIMDGYDNPIDIQGGTVSGIFDYSQGGGGVVIRGNTLTSMRNPYLVSLGNVARNPLSAYTSPTSIAPVYSFVVDNPLYSYMYPSPSPNANQIEYYLYVPGAQSSNDFAKLYLNGTLLP